MVPISFLILLSYKTLTVHLLESRLFILPGMTQSEISAQGDSAAGLFAVLGTLKIEIYHSA